MFYLVILSTGVSIRQAPLFFRSWMSLPWQRLSWNLNLVATSCQCDWLAFPLSPADVPEQLVFRLSSGRVSPSSSVSLFSVSGWQGFVVNHFLALLFCAPHQSEPATRLLAFLWQNGAQDRLVSNPPPLDCSALLALLSTFSSVSLICFSPFTTSLWLCRLFIPVKRSDSPPSSWPSGSSRQAPTAVTYLVRGRLSQAQRDSACPSVRPSSALSTLTPEWLVQPRSQVCVFMCASVRVGMCTY